MSLYNICHRGVCRSGSVDKPLDLTFGDGLLQEGGIDQTEAFEDLLHEPCVLLVVRAAAIVSSSHGSGDLVCIIVVSFDPKLQPMELNERLYLLHEAPQQQQVDFLFAPGYFSNLYVDMSRTSMSLRAVNDAVPDGCLHSIVCLDLAQVECFLALCLVNYVLIC